jgi:hypothetical protein
MLEQAALPTENARFHAKLFKKANITALRAGLAPTVSLSIVVELLQSYLASRSHLLSGWPAHWWDHARSRAHARLPHLVAWLIEGDRSIGRLSFFLPQTHARAMPFRSDWDNLYADGRIWGSASRSD